MILSLQFHSFHSKTQHKGKDLYFIQNDPCFSLLLLAISFLKPSSIHYASILNEIGRYTQSHYQYHSSSSSILTNSLFQSGISCYKQALQLFEKVNDYINASVILCNICQFIHIPLQVFFFHYHQSIETRVNSHFTRVSMVIFFTSLD